MIAFNKRRILPVLALATFVFGAVALYAWFDFRGPEIPPSVSGEEWMPISSDLGLVVREISGNRLGGYLMTRVDGQWMRVVLVDPDTMGFLPAR